MSSDDLYKNIGFVVVVIVFAYIVHRVIKFQNNVVEGMGIRDNTPAKPTPPPKPRTLEERSEDMNAIKEDVKKQEQNYYDYMNLKVNKTKYDEILVSQYNNLGYFVTNLVLGNAQTITANPNSTESIGLMVATNAMKEYMKTTDYVANFLDYLPKIRPT